MKVAVCAVLLAAATAHAQAVDRRYAEEPTGGLYLPGTPLAGEYDIILIDSPPSLGLLTVNGLTAADAVLVPMQCEYFALEGIVLTMYDERMNLCRQVADEVRNHFGDKVYDTVIPRNVRLGEAPSFGKPIILYDIRSRGSEAYVTLAKEFIRRAEGGIR